MTPNFQVEILGFDTHTVPRPPARASHKMRRPASRENGPHDFFYFGARSRNNYPQIGRLFVGVATAPFFRYGRERAAAATLTYYSNNVRENEVYIQ